MSHSSTSSRKAGAEFLSKNRYKSTIPPLPFDPKSLKYPFPEDMLYKYRVSSLEKSSQYSLPVPDIHLDLIAMGVFDPDQLNPSTSQRREKRVQHSIDPRDEALLVDPDALGDTSSAMSASRARPMASFLRKSDFIEPDASSRSTSNLPFLLSSKGSESRESKVLSLTDTSREGQIKVIQSTFTACESRATKQLQHPQDPSLTPVNILPILPDLRLWPYMYSHVSSDEPLGNIISNPNYTKKETNSVFRPKTSSESRTLFFLYNQDTFDETDDYKYKRAYSFSARPNEALNKFFLIEHQGKVVYYAPIKSKLILTKFKNASLQNQPVPPPLHLNPHPPEEKRVEELVTSLVNLGVAKELAQRYLEFKTPLWHE